MKKLLPTIIICVVFFATLAFAPFSYAQNASPVPPTQAAAPVNDTPEEGAWVKDSEVTFAGKLVARSEYFLGSMLEHYEWYFISPDSSESSLVSFWVTIRNIVYIFFGVLVLVTAFIIIINRGKNMTVMRFIPRFIGIALLVTLSFTLIQFMYQLTDITQGFFLDGLRNAQGNLSSQKLINVNFASEYADFVGYRLYGAAYDESTFVSLLLVKLTAVTMYVMAGVLFVRKIILWLFIIISPIFPLLLLYAPIRNTGKIWFGEFLKWLLYGPLFSILLAAVSLIWSAGLFRNVSNTQDTSMLYPTSINILLGGPGQLLSVTNSINGPDTFLLYILSLMMLWTSLVLPFVLLQIFLDYFQNYQPAENTLIKQAVSLTSSFLNKPPVGPKPPSLQPTGMAMPLPFGKAMPLPIEAPQGMERDIPVTRPVTMNSQINRPIKTTFSTTNPVNTTISRPVTTNTSSPVSTNSTVSSYTSSINAQPVTTQHFNQVTSSVLKTTNLTVPTLRDIARFDTTIITNKESVKETSEKTQTTLEKIANPRAAATSAERDQFRIVRDQLISEKQKGNPVAATILHAATTLSETKKIENKTAREQSTMNTASTSSQQVNKTISENGIQTTAAIRTSMVSHAPTFPVVNRVQTVSLEDYESVKKMWQDNYTKLEAPKTQNGIQRDKKEWIQDDITNITETINKLQSSDPKIQKEGMNMVSSILPFLLMGGFSQTEIIAYLKAKMEAGKTTLSDIDKKQDNEDTMVDRNENKKEQAEKTMTAQAEMPEEKEEEQVVNGV